MPPRRKRTREEKDARNERERASRRQPPHSTFINADIIQMAAYQQDREEHQATMRRRQAEQRAMTLTSLSPTPHSIILANDLLGLPTGTSLSPNVHNALIQIDDKFHGLLQAMDNEGLSVMWEKFKSGNRTFLHIWRVEVQGELQGKSGSMDILRRRQACWDKCCSLGQSLLREFEALIVDWQAPSSLLWWSSSVEHTVQFLQLMTLLLEEEILSFLTGGQWGKVPDAGVKRELMKKIKTKGATFVHKGERQEFTLQCLLPGGWLTGSAINFFIAKWQPAPTDGVRICNGWFWINRLENVMQQSKDAGLSKREREEKENDAWKRVFEYRFGVTATDPGVRLATHLTHFPASRFIIPLHIHDNHWIVAHIDIAKEFISIYDSWPATWERNNAIKDNRKTEHWSYIAALSTLTVRLMETMQLKAPDFTSWTVEPHKKVPSQVNSCDCGVFTLLFIYHLKCGGLNSEAVPLKYRFDMPGKLEGLVGGELDGARYALVEEALSEVASEHVENEEVLDSARSSYAYRYCPEC